MRPESSGQSGNDTPLVVGIDARVCLLQRRGWARYARELILALSSLDNLQLKVLIPSTLETAEWLGFIQYPHSVITAPFSPESPDRYWNGDSSRPEEWFGPVDLLHSLCRFVPPTDLRPVLVTVHDIVPLSDPPFKLEYRDATIKALEKLRQPHCWITAVSNQTMSELKSLGEIDDGRIRVIHEGVSGTFRENHDPRLREDLLPPGLRGSRYFVFVGGAGENKNLHNLMAAFEEVHRQSGAKLVLVGEKSWGYSEIFAGIDPPDWACLLGYVTDEELCSIYQGAFALVLPSFHEGFGLPIIEAMASGLPVVCSNIAVFRELAAEAAVYFDPGDPRAISESMLLLFQDTDLHRRLSLLGRERSILFSWEKAARLTREYYRFIRTQYIPE
jgi:alpha-1,3-rhamnosyl/mannosyltransferase